MAFQFYFPLIAAMNIPVKRKIIKLKNNCNIKQSSTVIALTQRDKNLSHKNRTPKTQRKKTAKKSVIKYCRRIQGNKSIQCVSLYCIRLDELLPEEAVKGANLFTFFLFENCNRYEGKKVIFSSFSPFINLVPLQGEHAPHKL